MGKATKIWLIIGICLVVLGGLISVGAMSANRWNFSNLSTDQGEIIEHSVSESYQNISISTDTANIIFAPTTDSDTLIVCNEQNNQRHSAYVRDNTLIISLNEHKKWYENISLVSYPSEITVYLPASEYGNLTIENNTGDIRLPQDFQFDNIEITGSTSDVTCSTTVTENLKITLSTGGIHIQNTTASNLSLTTTTGRITASNIQCSGDLKANVTTGKSSLTNIRCLNFFSVGDTGKLSLYDVIAAEAFSIERSTGDVEFENCDAGEILIETDTGDVDGNFLTEKIFITQTDTGDIDVPKSVTGGKCEISTSTGDIEIEIGRD